MGEGRGDTGRASRYIEAVRVDEQEQCPATSLSQRSY
jgi:hypothetical protein